MTAEDIKRMVSPEEIARYYGSAPNAQGRWRCICPERHLNGDQDHSMTIKNGRAMCWSQQCLGERGADIFEMIRIKEEVGNFPDQKKRAMDIGGLSNTKNGKSVAANLNQKETETELIQRANPPEGVLGKDVFRYCTSGDTAVLYVKRSDQPDGTKTFCQWGPTEDGNGWQSNTAHAVKPYPFYNLQHCSWLLMTWL